MISAVIFFPGCNLRCPWCHNGELAMGTVTACVTLEEALAHIKKRKHLLGGVVLSGGEPTLFAGLGGLVSRIKSLNLKVKIDTNGLYPEALERLFANEKTRPDYIAMDLKTAPDRYWELLPEEGKTEQINPGEKLKISAALIRSSGITHEFRSIALPVAPFANTSDGVPEDAPSGAKAYFSEQDRAALALLAGDSPWNMLPFVPGNCLDPRWNMAGIP